MSHRITISDETLDWYRQRRGTMPLSKYIEAVLKEAEPIIEQNQTL
jgi:hypothetical protein